MTCLQLQEHLVSKGHVFERFSQLETGRKNKYVLERWRLTLTFLSSAVVSSNSSPSLKDSSVFLMVLWVFTVILSPSKEMMVVGLVMFPTVRVANPTPAPKHTKQDMQWVSMRVYSWKS